MVEESVQGDENTASEPERAYDIPPNVPTFYCDSLQLSTSVWGSTLYIGELRPGAKPVLHARIKVSPQMLRAVALLANKHVHDYSKNVGEVSLPDALLRSWGIEEETTE